MTRRILGLAIPNIISNISVPLLAIADTAIAGRMEHLDSIGAVAMASTIVNFSYWLWGFLRMATTGFTAQAYGRGDLRASCRQFCVGTSTALLGGLLITILSPWLASLVGILGNGSPSLIPEAEAYLRVAYLGAPAALLLYVYNGWFVGMQNTIVPMITTIVSNVLNIIISIALAHYWRMGVEGIAWGTVVAQYLSIAILVLVASLKYRRVFAQWHWRDFFRVSELFTYIHIAKYLLLRTLMLGSISLYFVHAGSTYGPITLAANTLLIQLFTTFSYFMDGFAYAGEALTGRYIGARQGDELRHMLRSLIRIGWVMAPTVAVIYYFFAGDLLHLLSDKMDVIVHAEAYRIWVVVIPLVSFAAFLWDGIFVGMTNSKPMMQAVLLAWLTFYGVYFSMNRLIGEDTLWLAFVLYLMVRSLLSVYWGRKLVGRVIEDLKPAA